MMRALLLLCVVSLCACRGASGGRADARAIVRAYEGFQQASSADRPAALDALSRARCDDASACSGRDACVTYARHLMRAQELLRKARELGPEDAGGSGAATGDELAVIVSAADDETKAATTTEPACRAALDRLYQLAR